MFRKLTAFLLIISLCFAFCSCGITEDNSNSLSESRTQTSLNSQANIITNNEEIVNQSTKESASDSSIYKSNSVTVQTDNETFKELVWIPTRVGKKYHIKASCSGMKDPVQVTRETAENKGFTPCKNCY